MSISSTLVDRAEIRFREAATALRPFVGCFWVVTAQRHARIRVVPDGCTSISIEVRNSGPSTWSLRGPLIRPDELRFTSQATLVGIRLHPGVAFLLSRVPANTMVGRRIRLTNVPAFHDLVADECFPGTPEQFIDLLERFLLRRLEHASLDVTVATALRDIERHHGCVRVPDVAARCGVSTRHLHRVMRVWIGYGPKRYASVVRFQATLHGMDDRPDRASAVLAAENGFFDQAHLTLDLGRFAGATPGHLTSTSVADFSKTRCDDLP
jgi:AraC-like DNA-binding protein